MSSVPDYHPTDETLALFASGEVDSPTRNGVLAHIESCSDCMAAVLSANAHLAEERSMEEETPSSSRWWMSAVAAAVLLALIITVPLSKRRDPIGRLVSLAPATERTVEPRLSGGFAWAPYRGPMRAADSTPNVSMMKLQGAAGDLVERADRDHAAKSQHAAGVAMVLIDKPEAGAARLETAARESHDATSWNDLAAARYAAALELGRASLYPAALAAADEALRSDPRLPEALFNRALILERMGFKDEARHAWQRYLEVDPTSRWATEAREHLK